jgi:hypothetical protein
MQRGVAASATAGFAVIVSVVVGGARMPGAFRVSVVIGATIALILLVVGGRCKPRRPRGDR